MGIPQIFKRYFCNIRDAEGLPLISGNRNQKTHNVIRPEFMLFCLFASNISLPFFSSPVLINIMKILVNCLLLFLAINVGAQVFTGKVVKVIDGNTFEIIDEHNEVSVFMLSEVDCPEIGQPVSEEALAFSKKMTLKKKVVVERRGKDWLGNKLAVISLKNDKILHEELLKSGYAWAVKKAPPSLHALQEKVQKDKRGIWSADEPTPPWVYRRKQTMMVAKGR